jgi:hypothetical protein
MRVPRVQCNALGLLQMQTIIVTCHARVHVSAYISEGTHLLTGALVLVPAAAVLVFILCPQRRAMLGLPDGDIDPFFDTLPDQQQSAPIRGIAAAAAGSAAEGGEAVSPDESSSSEREGGDDSESEQDESSVLEGLLQDPPELVAARRKLEAFRQQQQAAGERAHAHTHAHGTAPPVC